MKLTVHCIVKNEDQWIWFALQSVLPFADKILIYDTGSTDKTVAVIKTIKSPKIKFVEKGSVNVKKLVELRQEQIEETKTDWFLILDGDEIWPEKNLEKLLKFAVDSSKKTLAIFSRARNCVGDVYHYLPESAGRYEIAGVKGNLNIRLIRKTKDLKVEGEYPLEAFKFNGTPIQDLPENLEFIDTWYLHTTFLKRSSSDVNKTSGSFGKKKVWQRGIKMDESELPEALKMEGSDIVPNPLFVRGIGYETMADLLHPVVSLKRKLR